MADAKLSREHALKLLHRLANDDEFRKRFETKPAKALVELGVPAEHVVDMHPGELAPVKLASKDKFKELHARVLAQPSTEWLCMIIPEFRISPDAY